MVIANVFQNYPSSFVVWKMCDFIFSCIVNDDSSHRGAQRSADRLTHSPHWRRTRLEAQGTAAQVPQSQARLLHAQGERDSRSTRRWRGST